MSARVRALARPRLPLAGLVGMIAATGALAMAAGAAWGAVQASPRFVLARIQIEGAQRLDEQEVRELATVRLGRPLVEINADLVARRLERAQWIAAARVERRWPSTLHITIEERIPRAMVLADGLYAMDDLGFVFKRVEAADRFDLPVVTGIPLSSGPAAASARLSLAALLLDTIESHAPELVIDELHQDRVGRWSIVIAEGREIVLGPTGAVRPALERYAQLDRSILNRNTTASSSTVVRVDVSDPVHAYVHFAAVGENATRTSING